MSVTVVEYLQMTIVTTIELTHGQGKLNEINL